MHFNKELAECVGLWLAEGDRKTKYEVTFTNNCWVLIELFHNTIVRLIGKDKNVRVYVYNTSKKQIEIPIKAQVNHYVDKRATKPYYIWRFASVEFNKQWKNIVKEVIEKKSYYDSILKGIFAGEGNIKTGSHCNRTLRISQKTPSELFNLLLDYYKISYRFYPRERSYVITSKFNWDKCARIRIADLHPIKKEYFWRVYNGYKEEHYSKNYLEKSILKDLVTPYTSNNLGIKYNRSQARVYDVLDVLKKSNIIQDFRVRSVNYWIRKDQKIIIISSLKGKYLDFLGNTNKNTKVFSIQFNVNWRSAFKRLKELEKLGLVKRERDKTWRKTNMKEKVILL